MSTLVAENMTVATLIYWTRGSHQEVTERTFEKILQDNSQLVLFLQHLLEFFLLQFLLFSLSLHPPGLVPLDHLLSLLLLPPVLLDLELPVFLLHTAQHSTLPRERETLSLTAHFLFM